jgi:excisionase family DNA binding protein
MPEMRTHEESLPVLLTPREVASTLRVDLITVYRMIDRGTLGAVQFGGARHTVRIPAAELVRLSASPKPVPSHGTQGVRVLPPRKIVPPMPPGKTTTR